MVQGIILDIIIVALIALSVFLGYKKGFANLAIRLVSLIISIVVTVLLYNPIANLVINTTSVDETLENHIYEKVIQMMKDDNKEENYLGITVEQAQSGMLPTAARELSINIIRLTVFLLLVILIKIGVRFISVLSNLLAKLPLLKQFNDFGGIAYGLLRGLLIVLIGLIIVKYITTINPKNQAYSLIENSYVTKALYDNNVINIFFK